MKMLVRKVVLLGVLALSFGLLKGQNAIDGTGFNYNWSWDCSSINNFLYLSPSAGGTYITTLQPNYPFQGDKYFLLAVEWDGVIERRSIAVDTDTLINIGQKYTLIPGCPSLGTTYVNSITGHENFIFKTLDAGTDPTGDFVVFRVSGDVRSVNTVSQFPAIVPEGQFVTITATMSAALATGQSAYLRYTLDDFATSVVVPMTGSTTAPTAQIPANAQGQTVKYYVFTSGSGLTIPGSDADLFTINYNTNNGSNYSYQVQAGGDFFLFDSFQRTNYGAVVDTPSSNPGSPWLEYETTATGARTSGGGLHMGSITPGRDMISFDMSNHYPVAFDASDEEMKWAFNLNINITDPSGFEGSNRGAAFILGCNKSNFTDPDAKGYAVVLGNSGAPDHIRIVKFQNGLILNGNLTDIISVPNTSPNKFFSIIVSYNSCSNTWNLQVREDSVFFQPNIGSFPHSASAVDSTYTSSDLPHLGALWKHSTGSGQEMRIDNIYIPNVTVSSNIEYTWVGGSSGNFGLANNWNPPRVCARSRDRLIFNGGTSEVFNVPNQTIGQIQLLNNATVSLKDPSLGGVPSRLILSGGEDQDLIIPSGSTLIFDVINTVSGNGIVLDMSTLTTGEIAGTLRFENTGETINPGGRPHQLLVTDADALHIKDGGRVEAVHLLLGVNPFGDTRAEDAVIFENGSTYLQASGSNPFGYAHGGIGKSKVVFEPGSWYHFTASTLPSVAGRTFANFRYDSGSMDLTGGSNYFIDTLQVVQGTVNFNLNATATIAGDIEVLTGATLNFSPPLGTAQILINAPVEQNIYGAGNMTIGTGVTLNLQNPNRINIKRNIIIEGKAQISTYAAVDFEGENRFTSTGMTTIQNNSKVYIGSVGGIAIAAIDAGNIRTTTRTYSGQVAYIYDGTTNQVTGTGLPITLTGNGSLEIDNPENTVTQTNALTTTPLLTLTNGLFAVGATNTIAIAANGSVKSTAGNFAPGNLAGKVIFKGIGTVNATGALDFYDVELASGSGGVNFGVTGTGTETVHHEMVIKTGRHVDTTAPFYADNSTLVYNTGNYTTGSEWYALAETGRGVPYNVQVGRQGVNNTNLDFGSSNAWRACRNTINIGDAAGGSGYKLSLSTIFEGDLKVGGDFILNANGTFDAKQRSVTFNGITDQTITSLTASHKVDFDYLILDKTGGDLLLNDSPGTTVSAMGNNGGAVLVLSGGDLDLQGQVFNLGGTGPDLKIEGDLLDVRVIKSDTPAEFNIIGAKQVVSQSGTPLIFNNKVTVNISAGMDFGPDITTINATLQINQYGFANTHAPFYGPNGILKYNTNANPYNRRVEWSGVEGDPGYPNDVIVAGNTILNPGGDPINTNTGTAFGARRNITIESGSAIYMDYGSDDMTVALKVGADLTINGSLSASDVYGGDIHVGGNWVRNAGGVFNPKDRQVLFNSSTPQAITADGGETFDYLAFDSAGTKELLSDITVNKDIDFYLGTGPLSGDGQTIHLHEDWNNAAGETAFTETNTKVSFDGNTLQNVNCAISSFEGFHHMKINNTGDGLKLNNNASIFGNLEFVNGLIDATAINRVDFQAGSSNSGASSVSYINGFARKIGFASGVEFMFPVGQYNATDPMNIIDVYQPAGLIANNTSATAAFTVDYNHQSYFPWAIDPNNLPPMQSPLVKASTCNYWNINRDVAGTNARVRLYWTAACFDISNPNDLVVAKVDGGQWVSQGAATATSSIPYSDGSVVTTAAVTSFSAFAIGSTSNINVLPIQLLSFTATPKNRQVETHWSTSTEINNDYFTVERSVDALNFEEVGRVEGAGNSTTQLSYSFTDDAPFAGISYYRLKQTDFDGTYTYSEIRAIKIGSDNRFELLQVYRSDDEVNLVYRSEAEVLKVEIFDLLGKRLFVNEIRNEAGRNTILPSLVRGIYLLRLSNGVEVVSEKFFY